MIDSVTCAKVSQGNTADDYTHIAYTRLFLTASGLCICTLDLALATPTHQQFVKKQCLIYIVLGTQNHNMNCLPVCVIYKHNVPPHHTRPGSGFDST